ncbi:MAG: GH1 family beta-glucosidase [Gemmatimonadota bacterium]
MTFPSDFVWGAAAASYQVEGAACEDGKGLSVWDTMCRWPGKVWQGQTGAVSCDHYHRYEEDAGLMGEIGLKAYRLSVSWPRVLPAGVGAANEKGLAFYDRLIDALLARGVDPWVTLFHWDYPHALYARGGWLSPDSPAWFAEYAGVIVDRLSDRVTHWMTQNEPQCYLGLGHQTGIHAPGVQWPFEDVLRATHHSLLAHGRAVQVIRARARRAPQVGAAPVGVVKMPATASAEDVEAARRRMFAIAERDCWNNTWFADPMILGKYPEDGLALFGEQLPPVGSGDLESICQPLDFYGVNVYHGETVRAVGNGCETVPLPEGHALTAMEWPVTPAALYWGPRFLYERYGLPIAVTENGMANCDWVQCDGRVRDPQRIDFLCRYLRELGRAIADGVPGIAYFTWSILDNFEWSFGYKRRFGLIYVDYPSGKRILKDSARWYGQVIASNGASLEEPGEAADWCGT